MLHGNLVAFDDIVTRCNLQTDERRCIMLPSIMDDIPEDSVSDCDRWSGRGLATRIDHVDRLTTGVNDCVSFQEIIGRLNEHSFPSRMLHNIVPHDIVLGRRQDKNPPPMILDEVVFNSVVFGSVRKSDARITGVDWSGRGDVIRRNVTFPVAAQVDAAMLYGIECIVDNSDVFACRTSIGGFAAVFVEYISVEKDTGALFEPNDPAREFDMAELQIADIQHQQGSIGITKGQVGHNGLATIHVFCFQQIVAVVFAFEYGFACGVPDQVYT